MFMSGAKGVIRKERRDTHFLIGTSENFEAKRFALALAQHGIARPTLAIRKRV